MLDTLTPHPTDVSPRALAFYLPQFHPIPENDRFWGKGFTEWHNVVRARPRFRGHAQPHLPADLGFYDLRLAQTRAAQAKMARQAGVSGFCWYHYWFSGRRVMNAPFDAMLRDTSAAFPFMLCWANENWTRAWDGGPREVLIAQDYSDADTRAHARHLAPALADPRAVRVDDRPVFAVYNTDDLPDARRWSDIFRKTLQGLGLDVFLIRVERHLDRDRRAPAALGFDAALDFQPFSRGFSDWTSRRRALPLRLARRADHLLRRHAPRDRRFDMEDYVTQDLARPAAEYPLFPSVCPSWDNAARRPAGRAITFKHASPALFARWTATRAAALRSDAPILFVNAWNEWAEGNHLEPCQRHGHAWLDALRDGLTAAAISPGAVVSQKVIR